MPVKSTFYYLIAAWYKKALAGYSARAFWISLINFILSGRMEIAE